jgi:hypothetical protein
MNVHDLDERCPGCGRNELTGHSAGLSIQPKLTVSQPDDPYEQEADRVAEKVMRMPAPGVQRKSACPTGAGPGCRDDEEKDKESLVQRKVSAHSPPALDVPPIVHDVLQSPGEPLDAATRAFFEPRFGHEFSNVRVHADTKAAESARAVGAIAYTVGRNVVFGAGQYVPHSDRGRKLLTHELAHIVQQLGSSHGHDGVADGPKGNALSVAARVPGAKVLLPAGGSVPAGYIQRQAAPAAPAAAVLQVGTVQDAIDFLQAQERFISSLREMALMRINHICPVPIHVAYAELYRVHTMLSQKRMKDFLHVARSTYEFQVNRLPENDPQRVTLRAAFVRVLHEIRLGMNQALTISNRMVEARVAQPERIQYAENLAAWIEAVPMTSSGLAGTTAFQAADVAAATSYEAELEGYLNNLLMTLPGMNLNQAQKDDIHGRIQVALRRAFVTVGPGASGTVDVRAISNAAIREKYQRVITLLGTGVTRPSAMDLITSSMPPYALPDPVPDVAAQFGVRAVDVTRVPESELASVRYGVLQAVRSIPPPGIVFRNAYWPLVLQVRRGGAVIPVRYELVFDSTGNVRVERLGTAAPREVTPAFQQLSVVRKKAQLVFDFGLAAVDDRPAWPASHRPAAVWSASELDQVNAAFDLIPARDRAALAGVTLVRDHQGPAPPGATTLTGVFHTRAEAAYDQPGPPPHNPPHIHYYDAAFRTNAALSVGPGGATGPGGDWWLLHEVGHGRMAVATRAANTAIAAANAVRIQRLAQLNGAIAGVAGNAAMQQAWTAWNNAQLAAQNAVVAFNQSLVANPPAAAAQQAALLLAAQNAIAARNAARGGLNAAAFPANVLNAATNLDASTDALLTAVQQLAAAQDQVPIFVALAGQFGFHRFTRYARIGATDEEWFAETYALYLTDPHRLLQMNRSIFAWFEAGMPMDRTWRPPVP